MNLTELQKADPETFKDIGQLCLYAAALPQYEIDEDSKDLPSPRIWYAIIQACLQRAIEKRGWHWLVEDAEPSVKVNFRFIADIVDANYDVLSDYAGGNTPAEALLAAYLEAIHETS